MERAETHRLIHTSIIFTNLGVPWYFTKPHFYQMVYDGYPYHTIDSWYPLQSLKKLKRSTKKLIFETLNYLSTLIFYRSTPTCHPKTRRIQNWL